MKIKLIFLLSSIFILFTSLFSQNISTNLEFENGKEKQLFFRLEGSTFLKNNEYFNTFSKGFTGVGFFAKPHFYYYLNTKTRVHAGYYLLKYAGIDTFSKVVPVFRIHHKASPKLQIIMGNIEGSLSHNLYEPLYRSDRYYQEFIEYGLQFLYNSNRVKSDLWLDWYRYIFPEDTHQEEFVLGYTGNASLFKTGNYTISFPFQMLFFHKGGQINDSDEFVKNVRNVSLGLRGSTELPVGYRLNGDMNYLLYSGPDDIPFPSSGSAILSNISLFLPNGLQLQGGYWKADSFIAPRGEFLFQSISNFDDSFFEAERELLFFKVIYKPVSKDKKVRFNAFVNSYYDLKNANLDYSFGLYISVFESFFIKQL